MFEERKLKKDEDKYITELIARTLRDGMETRGKSNSFLESVQNIPYVTHVLRDFVLDNDYLVDIPIMSTDEGEIRDIDITRLSELMIQEYSPVEPDNKSLNPRIQQKRPLEKVVLVVRPGAVVKHNDVLVKLYIPKDSDAPSDKFVSRLKKSVNIVPISDNSPSIRLDELVSDFKQQIRTAIDNDNPFMVEEALEFYGLLTKGLTNFGEDEESPEYRLENARKEYQDFFIDGVSGRLQEIASVINDGVSHAFKLGREDTTRIILTYLYRDLRDVTESLDVISIARANQSFMSAITDLVLGDERNIKMNKLNYGFFDFLTFRLEEHTELLMYKLKRQGVNQQGLEDWLYTRIDDIRGTLLVIYKYSKKDMFNGILKTARRIEEFSHLYPDNIKGPLLYLRCSIFVLGAYIKSHPEKDTVQESAFKAVQDYLSGLSAVDITEVLIESLDKEYIDRWRVDVYDLVADRKAHSVPDLSGDLKSLWIEYMLSHGIGSIGMYVNLPLSTTLTFTAGRDDTESNYFLKTIEESDAPVEQKKALIELVKSFIKTREDWETQELIDKPLSPKRIKEFKEGVLKGFQEQSVAYKILSVAKKVNPVEKATADFLNFGWNQITDKQYFIDDWFQGYFMPSDQYGSEIAVASDVKIIEKMVEDSKHVTEIEALLSKLKKSKTKWVLICRNVGSWYIAQQYEKLLKNPGYNQDLYFNQIEQLLPVQFIYDESNEKGLYAIPESSVGSLSIKDYNQSILEVKIQAFSHDQILLKQLLDNPPAWLSEKGKQEQQSKFLTTKARMLINYTFYYRRYRKETTFYVPIDDSN